MEDEFLLMTKIRKTIFIGSNILLASQFMFCLPVQFQVP